MMSVRKRLIAVGLSLSLVLAVGWSVLGRRSPDEEFRIGQRALIRGEWAVVSRQIDRLQSAPQYQNQRRVLRGGLILRLGDAEGALAELAKVVPGSGVDVEALLLRCEAYYQLKQWVAAGQQAQELLRQHPDHPEAHRWLGAIYYDLGANQQAEYHLMEVARLLPTDYGAHRLLGLIHSDFERYKDAIVDYERALERSPPQNVAAELRLELATSQIKDNRFDLALKTLEDLQPSQDLKPRLLAAECLWSLGRRDEARQMLRLVQADAPDDPQVLWLVARIALDDGRIADAHVELQRIVAAEPSNHQALYQLSLAYRKLGREAEADDTLQRHAHAKMLMEKLVELNRQALNEPNNAIVRDDLASVCDQLGKNELAEVWRDAARALRSATPQTK